MAKRKAKTRKAAAPGPAKRRVVRKRVVVAMPEARGPFDIVGDVHGCLDELLELLNELGYRVKLQRKEFVVKPPRGRKLAFLGDFVDRGPAAPAVLRLAMGMVRAGTAICVAGNRDVELERLLGGRRARMTRGMTRTLSQLAGESASFCENALGFLRGLPSHLLLDEGRLALAHAGLKEAMLGHATAAARAFALHGELTGEYDAAGMPIRKNWAADYRGKTLVVYGHTPVAKPLWQNNTVNIDTGCVYGGHLTALRYPECTTVSVPATAIHYPPRRVFPPNRKLKQKQK
jgi:protein phosphatase